MPSNILKYDSDVVWSLPGLFQSETIIGAIKQLIKKIEPETTINLSAYGSPHVLWTGEIAHNVKDEIDEATFDLIFEYLNEVDTVPIFNFTNSSLEKEDLNDPYANFVLNMALKNKSKFSVYDDNLKNYIKEKDSQAFIIASSLKAVEKFQGTKDYDGETKYYNELLKEYDMITLRPEYVKNALLKDLSLIDDLSKVEIQINSSCQPDCKVCMEHAKLYDDIAKNIRPRDIKCPLQFIFFKELYNKNMTLNQNEIQQLIDKGVKQFKFAINKKHQTDVNTRALMIASQIFNTDGSNFYILDNLLPQQLGMEFQYFSEKFRPSAYYRKVLS